MAAQGDAKNIEKLSGYLRSDRPEIRFWGASGFATLGGAPATFQRWTPPDALLNAVKDADAAVAAEAAHALCYEGRADVGMPALLDAFDKGSSAAHSALETLASTDVGAEAMRPHLPRLRQMAGTAPAAAESDQGDDAEGVNVGWRARTILVNLRAMPVGRLYDESQQQQGRKNNGAKRPLVPTP